jgi:hypothetical protein
MPRHWDHSSVYNSHFFNLKVVCLSSKWKSFSYHSGAQVFYVTTDLSQVAELVNPIRESYIVFLISAM